MLSVPDRALAVSALSISLFLGACAGMSESERSTASGAEVTQTADNQLKLNIPSDISFASGRSDSQPNFRQILDDFARGLQNNPSARVTIIGHTDNVGSDAVNDPLSINRAASVRNYLSSRGISPNVISIDGRGEREPIASNATAEGRARNRRVEIFVGEAAR